MSCSLHGPACTGHAREAQQERPVLELQEVEAILAASDPEERAVFLLAYDLALRAGEVSMVRNDAIDWRGSKIRSPRSKKGRVYELGVASRTLSAIEPYARDHGHLFPRWSERRVRDAFREAARRAGLPVVGGGGGRAGGKGYSHILRRSRATHLIEAGAQLKDVQWRLGHKSPQTTLLYLGLTQARRREVNEIAARLIDRPKRPET